MYLSPLQRHLETIYEITLEHCVDDFLITDPAVARRLDTSANPREIHEKLLVRQDGDDVEVSLFVHADVLNRLRLETEDDILQHGNLAAICMAIEGVSHFLYLAWNAQYRRAVTLLELELQAEVDKYVSLSMLLEGCGGQRDEMGLHSRLFDQVSYDHALDESERGRYRDANHYAAKYCLRLERQYRHPDQRGSMLNDVRRFYRKTQGQKLRAIEGLA